MSALIERQDHVDGRFDTIAIMPGTERNSAVWRVYGRDLVVALGTDRVFAADTGADSILVLGLGGDTLDLIPVPFEPVEIPGDAKTVKTRPPVELPAGVVPPIPLDPPFDYPDLYPRLGRMVVDEGGSLWVMAYPEVIEPTSSWHYASTFAFKVEDGGARWRVLDPNGEVIAEVRTPDGFYALEIGEDYVLGLSKDEYDVEAVEIYSLTR
jgi:hypothetical protein